MNISIILDILVISLLVPTIIFAVILNNRLSILRKNREELVRLVAAFNDATVRAESGIPRLRKASEDASKALQEKVERAQILRDDLAFMIERADTSAGRLETSVKQARGEIKSTRAPAAFDIETAAEMAERTKGQSGERGRRPVSLPTDHSQTKSSSLASESRNGGGKSDSQRQPLAAALSGEAASSLRARSGGGPGDDDRSEAERELLRALQAVR